jgi:hypothetical protein
MTHEGYNAASRLMALSGTVECLQMPEGAEAVAKEIARSLFYKALKDQAQSHPAGQRARRSSARRLNGCGKVSSRCIRKSGKRCL